MYTKKKLDEMGLDDDCEHIRKKRKIDRFNFFEELPDELLVRVLSLTYSSKLSK